MAAIKPNPKIAPEQQLFSALPVNLLRVEQEKREFRHLRHCVHLQRQNEKQHLNYRPHVRRLFCLTAIDRHSNIAPAKQVINALPQ